jgi:single-stranded-DNA-specific exonuclease
MKGRLGQRSLSIKISKLYSTLEPFGREFEPPVFAIEGKILSLQSVGEKGIHLRLRLKTQEGELDAIWFNARENNEIPWPVIAGEEAQVIYTPKLQTFRGETKVSCQVVIATQSVAKGKQSST